MAAATKNERKKRRGVDGEDEPTWLLFFFVWLSALGDQNRRSHQITIRPKPFLELLARQRWFRRWLRRLHCSLLLANLHWRSFGAGEALWQDKDTLRRPPLGEWIDEAEEEEEEEKGREQGRREIKAALMCRALSTPSASETRQLVNGSDLNKIIDPIRLDWGMRWNLHDHNHEIDEDDEVVPFELGFLDAEEYWKEKAFSSISFAETAYYSVWVPTKYYTANVILLFGMLNLSRLRSRVHPT
ncbi:hypothetical protein MUK42_28606 [Musa troglodytarum]|uniref:Uncharacterized protein n=1 Tax=Musa troglodytarum TaxID=320322 RepID=A0A9E7GF54_9LILI|nr:hypothetical protein MUK42_28606 [Musa troglodytarum]